MRYWWVNQNQTFRQERAGGFLWSPKRRADGARNPFYEFMREVSPGDLVLSFEGTFIRAIGVAGSFCYECPKPKEFGSAGPNWDEVGWKVDLFYMDLKHQIRPIEHMTAIAPALPERYAPLQRDGRGLQGIYLTELPENLMYVLAGVIGPEAMDLMRATIVAEPEQLMRHSIGTIEWEEHLQREIETNPKIDETEKKQVIIARRGQGKFRENVQQREEFCRVTRVDRPEHLRASHLKPWRDANNEERLDGENGLLLTPSIDHLFDKGFISFADNGKLLVSPVAHEQSLLRMGVPTLEPFNAGSFSAGQRKYLDFHRNSVFLEAATK